MATIMTAQSCLPGGIDFLTQGSVDSFPLEYPDCSEIEGNVAIKGSEIVNLNGLAGVTVIGGNLTIFTNSALTSLAGLDQLTRVEGDMIIGDVVFNANPLLSTLSGLESLQIVGGDLFIHNNFALDSLSVHPNPVRTVLQVVLEGSSVVEGIIVYNLFGQIAHQDMDQDDIVDVGHLPAGLYLLEVIHRGGRSYTWIVVE